MEEMERQTLGRTKSDRLKEVNELSSSLLGSPGGPQASEQGSPSTTALASTFLDARQVFVENGQGSGPPVASDWPLKI